MATSPSAPAGLHDRGERVRFIDDVLPTSTLPTRYSPGAHRGDTLPLSVQLEAPYTPKTARRHTILAASSMILLTLQGTAMSIILRYSRIREGRAYAPSVAVAVAEIIKLLICITIQAGGYQIAGAHLNDGTLLPSAPTTPRGTPKSRIAVALRGALPMAVPAAMFVFQQILLIWAATYLDAVTYQIFNQAFKLIPTAIFARLLLGQKLRPLQWASIPVLAVGVILVSINNAPTTVTIPERLIVSRSMWLTAMAACSLSGLSSAFAGVYFERYVKGKHAAGLGLVQRNIQLGVFGVPLSVGYALAKDGSTLRQYGLFSGFGAAAWGVVLLQVFGGLVTGIVVKYCDNIMKNFSLATSVILTVLIAIPLFGMWPSAFFLAGVTFVLVSVFMYGGSTEDFKAAAMWIRGALRQVGGWGRRRRLAVALGASLVIVTLLGVLRLHSRSEVLDVLT